jgi:hypothetical protein
MNKETNDRGADPRHNQWHLRAARVWGHNQLDLSVYYCKAAALSASLRLWKHGLRPIEIVGPRGEIVSLAEIESYQAAEMRREHGDVSEIQP